MNNKSTSVLVSILLLFGTLSCKENNILSSNVSFEIANKSSNTVSVLALKLYSGNSTSNLNALNLMNLASGTSQSAEINLKNFKEVIEGSYLLSLTFKNGNTKEQNFGYFTNHLDSHSGNKYFIEINDNSIDIK